ncbi:MAG TPA: S8 family peptidase [Saprospiraceae bacterium]|nr:S8 family peptidase [Saprospiraceae bacterium]HMQ85638.1 S8 family peptidase [Saprospiraceae bacterium]
MNQKLKLLVLGLCLSTFVVAQTSAPPKNWFNLDPNKDGVPGISTEKTYQELLKDKQGQTVVVAVLDSGVDYEHEDLKDVMWVNEDEIPGNGIDDDKNGYIDDVHGWNFLGNKNGENIAQDNLEVTRLYVKLKAKYEGKSEEGLSKSEREELKKYKEYKKVIEEKHASLEEDMGVYVTLAEAVNKLAEAIGKDNPTLKEVEKFKSDDPVLIYAAKVTASIMADGQEFKGLQKDLNEYAEYLVNQYKYHYNPEFEPRSLVGDNYADLYQRDYGNNDVRGPDAMHGTHVAGIIAAKRGNGIGMDGVANNVRIMSVRTVPDGDERDKDVAAAIYYAVDNGASVINMSFGKGASPNKEVVDEAVKYAMEHDVLIVHAAGNDNKEVVDDNNFPTDRFEKKGLFGPKYAKNWIEVGAINYEKNEHLVAEFSNYSAEFVDVFAPGVEIYSTTPFNEYENQQGTSMAAPVVAGTAALLRSYFPDLNAVQVKEIIMSSAIPQKIKVLEPGSEKQLVPFSQLSVTGGIVSSYEAVKLAQQTKGKKKQSKKGSKTPTSNDSSKQKARPKA